MHQVWEEAFAAVDKLEGIFPPSAYFVNVTCNILVPLVNFTRNVEGLNCCEYNMESLVALDFLKEQAAEFHS